MTTLEAARGAVQRAREAPAWADRLGSVQVRSWADFEALPVTRRRDLQPLLRGDWSRARRPGPVASFLSSSATAEGPVALRAIGPREAEADAFAADAALRALFEAHERRTLVHSALPQGVRIPTRLGASIATGTRPELGAALLGELLPGFEQGVVVAEPLLAKELVELLSPRAERHRLHFVLGGDWMPENLRRYLLRRLGVPWPGSPEGRVLNTYGVGELGLNLAAESPADIPRRPPGELLLRPSPGWHVEAVEGELVWTALSPDRLQPAIRWAPGDPGAVQPGLVRLRPRRDDVALQEALFALPDELIALLTGALAPGPPVLLQSRRGLDGGSAAAALSDRLGRSVRAVPWQEFAAARWTPYEGKFALPAEPEGAPCASR